MKNSKNIFIGILILLSSYMTVTHSETLLERTCRVYQEKNEPKAFYPYYYDYELEKLLLEIKAKYGISYEDFEDLLHAMNGDYKKVRIRVRRIH